MELPMKIIVCIIIAIVAVIIFIMVFSSLTGDASSVVNGFFGNIGDTFNKALAVK